MKLQREVVEELKRLLPKEMLPLAWIAGGYAHHPELAKDIDLWVVGQRNFSVAEVRIHNHLTANAVRWDQSLGDGSDEGDPSDFEVVADVRYGKNGIISKPVQILVTNHLTIDSLLERFDISTHRIAYPLEHTNSFRVGQGYFPAGAQPRVLNFDFNPSVTLKRLYRLSTRYGFEPNADDVKQLEARLAA
jgi:hypothetical protein